jgi:hypothetical protein
MVPFTSAVLMGSPPPNETSSLANVKIYYGLIPPLFWKMIDIPTGY